MVKLLLFISSEIYRNLSEIYRERHLISGGVSSDFDRVNTVDCKNASVHRLPGAISTLEAGPPNGSFRWLSVRMALIVSEI